MSSNPTPKELFKKTVEPYKIKVNELHKEIGVAKHSAQKNEKLAPYYKIKSAALVIAYVNTCVFISDLSEKIQGLKDKPFLDKARKEISNCINELNKVFGELLSSGLTEKQELLETLSDITPSHKLRFFQELSEAIDNLKNALGEKSKWRWSFPDLHYRAIGFAKNWFDFKLFQKTKDFSDPNYRSMQEYMNFLMEECFKTAQEFRSRYELSTLELDDLYKIRNIFEMQKQLYILFSKKDELERIQTSLENINEKIQSLVAKKKKD